ncbi:hypothetical protein WBG99_34480 [Streptomyces sp. TG1A-60]|uniref:hypothetical protein n=1 Tax=Streptomyces sp. TG1A-60 TaxID=3129111 RepID=UPI0030D372C3
MHRQISRFKYWTRAASSYTHERVARAVLAWSDPDALRADDYEQVGLLLAGAARAVADDVRALAVRLPEDDGRRLFAEYVMDQADDCLARPSRNLLRVRDRARTLRALSNGWTGSRTP